MKTQKYEMCLTLTSRTWAKSLGLPVRLRLHGWAHDISNFHCKTCWCVEQNQKREASTHSDLQHVWSSPGSVVDLPTWRDWNKALWWFSRAWILSTCVSMETPMPRPCQIALKSYQHICVIVCVPFKAVQSAHLLRTMWLICCDGYPFRFVWEADHISRKLL